MSVVIANTQNVVSVIRALDGRLGMHCVVSESGAAVLVAIVDENDHGVLAHPHDMNSAAEGLADREVWAWDSAAALRALELSWPSLRDAATAVTALTSTPKSKDPIDTEALESLATEWSSYAGQPAPSAPAALRFAAEVFPLSAPSLQRAAIAQATAALSTLAVACEAHPDRWDHALNEVDLQRRFRARLVAGYRADAAELHYYAQCAPSMIASAQEIIDLDNRGELLGDTSATKWDFAFLDDTTGEPLPHELRSSNEKVRAARESLALGREYVSLRKAMSPNSRFYPTLKMSGAVTGRMSMSGVALQKLPARAREELLADPGHVLVSCDLPHIEVSVAAYLSGDAEMIAACQPGRDPYIELAQRLWGPEDGATDAARTRAKRGLLAPMYGQGAAALAAELDITVEDARALMDATRAAWPTYAAWAASVRSGTGPIRTVFGECIPAPEKTHARVNYTVQSTAAAWFKQLIIETDKQLREVGIPDALWLPVHDELVLHIPADRDSEAEVILSAVFSSPLGPVAIHAPSHNHGLRWSKTPDSKREGATP